MKRYLSKAKASLKKVYLCLCTSVVKLFYDRGRLRPELVYMQSRDGLDFAGNLLRVALELGGPEYSPKKIVLYLDRRERKRVSRMLSRYKITWVRLLSNKLAAACVCEIAAYVFLDSSVNYSYIKKDGQVVVNTWHGTPLKHMAKDSPSGRVRVGGGQRAHMLADYLVYPSRWMKQTMQSAYMIDGLYEGTNLYCGYPRNSVFLSDDGYANMRRALGLTDKQVFAYMPTFRGTFGDIRDAKQAEVLRGLLQRVDDGMRGDQILLVKLHVFSRKQIDMRGFRHIVPWPDGFETYDVLSAADCLITDYSSVFFDYANTGRKIILFPYDRDDYMRDRGVYMPLESLPFPLCETAEALLREMNAPKQYDDRDFRAKFDTFDCCDAAKKLCRRVFLGEETCEEERARPETKKVLIFGGSLAKNGITTAFSALLKNVDPTEYKYFASFRQWQIMGSPASLGAIPEGTSFLPIYSPIRQSVWEKFLWLRYLAHKTAELPEALKAMFRREWQRCYPGAHFDWVLDFDGYGVETMLFLKAAPAKAMTWVHSDMVPELVNRPTQHRGAFRYAYTGSRVTAVVSPDLAGSVREIAETDAIRISVIPNQFDEAGTVAKGALPLVTEPTTVVCSGNPGGLEGALASPGKKFVTVGRFSAEKAHLRLIEAFERFSDETPDAELFILGGHGDRALYRETVERAQRSRCARHITIVRSVANPMPILRRCDLFVFCSLYEGPSRAILEADCLGLPVIATDCVGVRPMMTEYGGYLTENSAEGLLRGMRDFMSGRVPGKLNVVHEAKNKEAMEAFVAALGDRG